jgi:hypothetical protein
MICKIGAVRLNLAGGFMITALELNNISKIPNLRNNNNSSSSISQEIRNNLNNAINLGICS